MTMNEIGTGHYRGPGLLSDCRGDQHRGIDPIGLEAGRRVGTADRRLRMRMVQRRTIDDVWRHIGGLVKTIDARECRTTSPTLDTLPSKCEPL